MEPRKSIDNMESLEQEIYRLKAESRRMEKDLNDNFDHFRENYKSYFLNSFFNRESRKAREKKGFFRSIFDNEAFESAMTKMVDHVADHVSNGFDNIVDRIFGNKK